MSLTPVLGGDSGGTDHAQVYEDAQTASVSKSRDEIARGGRALVRESDETRAVPADGLHRIWNGSQGEGKVELSPRGEYYLGSHCMVLTGFRRSKDCPCYDA